LNGQAAFFRYLKINLILTSNKLEAADHFFFTLSHDVVTI